MAGTLSSVLNAINKVRDYYSSDVLQQRFSALVTGESGSGKTFLLRTCRKPIHVDSFDPGGTKCLRDLISKGDIIADTRWENEDPLHPTKFTEWKRVTTQRLQSGYFKYFGTYCLDSATTWAEAVMNCQLSNVSHPGEAPKWNRDYTPQKVAMINYIKLLMSLPCDFILTGHLDAKEEVIGQTKTGEPIKDTKYRFLTTGRAAVTIPLQFDELYVLLSTTTSSGLKRYLVTEAQGKYIARSRLKAGGKLNVKEEPNIKGILTKIGLNWKDKPSLKSLEADNLKGGN